MDLRLAEALLNCCRYAQTGKRRDRPAGVDKEFQVAGAFAHAGDAALLEFPDHRVLAFQGTTEECSVEGFVDWAYNLRAEAVSALRLPGLVHAGFAAQLGALLPLVDEKLNKLDGTKPLYLTGFSQGGALAVLATAVLMKDERAVAATYIFATPRIGDVVFAKSCSTKVYRFEFGCDLVPHVPFKKPDSPIFQFAHKQLKHRLPDKLEQFLDRAEEKYVVYDDVGTLCYRASVAEPWKEYSTADERRLLVSRTVKLLTAGRRMCDDHLLEHYSARKKPT